MPLCELESSGIVILIMYFSSCDNSLWEMTGKLVQLVASLLECLRYCNERRLRRDSLRSPGFVAIFWFLARYATLWARVIRYCGSCQVSWSMSGVVAHVITPFDMNQNIWHKSQYLMIRAFVRVHFLQKYFSHRPHWYGLFPTCVTMCHHVYCKSTFIWKI